MRERILVVAAALLLAVSGLALLNVCVADDVLPVEMEEQLSIGDRRAAEGLRVDYRMGLNGNLRWYMQYDAASGENNTDFYLTYRGMEEPQWSLPWWSFNYRWKPLCHLADPGDFRDAVTSFARQSSSGETRYVQHRVYPIDYYDTYPIVLSRTYSDENGMFTVVENAQVIPFTGLKIPVSENDFAEMDFRFPDEGDSIYAWVGGMSYMKNRFVSYSLAYEGGVLFTVGFAAEVEPQQEWAPEGFGLWHAALERSSTTYDEYRATYELVYPLDITTQKVVLLQQSDDGTWIFLITAENEELVLHVISAETYHLFQKVSLGKAQVSERSVTSFVWEDYGTLRDVTNIPAVLQQDTYGETITIEYTDYPEVSLQQGDGFTVVMAGSELILLTQESAEFTRQFSCKIASLAYASEDPDRNAPGHWVFTNTGEAEKSYGWIDSFDATVCKGYTMVYNGDALAVAGYSNGSGGLMLLSVYGADGLRYAAWLHGSMTMQHGVGGSFSWEELWQDKLPAYQGSYMTPQPGLTWSA